MWLKSLLSNILFALSTTIMALGGLFLYTSPLAFFLFLFQDILANVGVLEAILFSALKTILVILGSGFAIMLAGLIIIIDEKMS